MIVGNSDVSTVEKFFNNLEDAVEYALSLAKCQGHVYHVLDLDENGVVVKTSADGTAAVFGEPVFKL